jgi:hemerythrin-like domain-containing protein
MAAGTKLLNDDGSASMATLLMMSHHALRRDLGRFHVAIARVKAGDATRVEALRNEWKGYHMALHGHHAQEDGAIFPDLREKQPALRDVLDRLSSDHRRIDPLLEKGDAAFAALPSTTEAEKVVSELMHLLDEHLTLEEANVAPHLRAVASFPPPPSEEMLGMYAQGFSWSMQGIAPEVTAQVAKMLPAALIERLPAAQAAFAERCEKVWGSAKVGISKTSVPAPLP